MRLNHLSPYKRIAQRLTAGAMCDLHNHDPVSAITNICTLLALVRNEHEERILISQLVRIAMAATATSVSWELLQATNLTDLDLARLQTSWKQQEFIAGLENSFLLERASTTATIESMRASKEESDRILELLDPSASGTGGGSGDWWADFQEFLNKARTASTRTTWRMSWSYADELRALQGQQVILEAMRQIRTNQVFFAAYTNLLSQVGVMGITNAPDEWFMKLYTADYRHIFSGEIGSLSRSVAKAMAIEAEKRLVIAAIALKRFQLKRGGFPEQLSELTPEFLSSIPLDPVDGKPLRYRRNADGTFLLYSVGEDGMDGGGDVSPVKPSSTVRDWNWLRARDWVWPQAATPAEVQDYYEHPLK